MQPSRPAGCQLTLLCVDDDADALLVRKTLLETAGYVVFSALDAESALRIFRSTQLDAVVSDHLLPDAAGTEMARQMKLEKPEIPIVLLSGVIDTPAGIEHTDAFLDKTEGPEKLLAAIAAVTGKSIPLASGARRSAEERGLSNQDCDQSAATMAHEVKNPLNSLANLLYLADAEPNVTGRGHHYLALAREEVSRLSQIAHAFLHRFHHGEAAEETNVPELLNSVVEVYKPLLESHGISVDTRSCVLGNVPVFAGPLRQVFSNLLLNASDAMPHGGRLSVRLATSHEWTAEKRPGLRVTFADTGCGIPEQNLPKIFKPFFTTKGSAGSGLGLSLVKDVVQRHNGSLRVRSSTKSGRTGSVFSVFLPAA